MASDTFQFHREGDLDLTIITVVGSIETEDIIRHLADFYDQFNTSKLIWDFSRAEGEHIDGRQLRRIVDAAKSQAHLREGGATAIVVPRSSQFGVARMYEILSDLAGHPIAHAVFRSLEEARAWLKATRPSA